MAKSAVLAAIHTEKVSSTVKAKPLSRHSERIPYFKSNSTASMVSGPPFLETLRPIHHADRGGPAWLNAKTGQNVSWSTCILLHAENSEHSCKSVPIR